MADRGPSKTVFVGNIPYGLDEGQIIDLFSTAGTVVNFRLVVDNETSRPKGYGFAEFADADSAASAVRNLNDHQVQGRQLRVDFSHKDNTGGTGGASGQRDGMNMGPVVPGTAPPVNVGGVPPGVPLPPGVSCPDAISQTLATIPPAQLLDILSQFKGVVSQNPESAAEILRQQPQLAYAIFQCLLTMGLVEADALKTVIEQVSAVPPPAAAPPVTATPPVHQIYQPPPQQQVVIPGIPPEQIQAIKSLCLMPDAQYNGLKPEERVQVDAIRQQYGAYFRAG